MTYASNYRHFPSPKVSDTYYPDIVGDISTEGSADGKLEMLLNRIGVPLLATGPSKLASAASQHLKSTTATNELEQRSNTEQQIRETTLQLSLLANATTARREDTRRHQHENRSTPYAMEAPQIQGGSVSDKEKNTGKRKHRNDTALQASTQHPPEQAMQSRETLKDMGIVHKQGLLPIVPDLNQHDILFAPDAGVFPNAGNQFFRRLVRQRQHRYSSANLEEKKEISRFLHDIVKSLSPPGRFLMLNPAEHEWMELDSMSAQQAVHMSLTDGITGIPAWRRPLPLSSDVGEQLDSPPKQCSKKCKVSTENVAAPKFHQLLQAAAFDDGETRVVRNNSPAQDDGDSTAASHTSSSHPPPPSALPTRGEFHDLESSLRGIQDPTTVLALARLGVSYLGGTPSPNFLVGAPSGNEIFLTPSRSLQYAASALSTTTNQLSVTLPTKQSMATFLRNLQADRTAYASLGLPLSHSVIAP